MHADLLPRIPVVDTAVQATAQYLYPNGYTVAFGDSHYGLLSASAARQMVQNAQKHGRRAQEVLFTRMLTMLQTMQNQNGTPDGQHAAREHRAAGDIDSLFARSRLSLDRSIPAGKLADFVSPTFSAPNVSFFVQRNGLDAETGLMISEAGSLGNHQHANGITMELYGKGVVLAPESGFGTSYFQPDHAEYYSQFPAHNTVVVDGISSYPAMKSNHGFQVLGCYPLSGEKKGIFEPVTYSDLYFLEPETKSDQRRLMSIIRTGPSNGYYLDIFRSRRRDGRDRMHDYIYHGLAQTMDVLDDHDRPLPMQPTEKLTFANQELPAYDYFWDKKSIVRNEDFHAVFHLRIPDKEAVAMNVWMAGEAGREIFSVKSPRSRALDGGMVPHEIAQLPMPALVVRQTGEAWTHPFVTVYEPVSDSQPSSIAKITAFRGANASIDFAGIAVSGRAGDSQYIFSDSEGQNRTTYRGMEFRGNYGIVSREATSGYLFLAEGSELEADGLGIETNARGVTASLTYDSTRWSVTANAPVTITIPEARLAGSRNLRLLRDGIPELRIEGRSEMRAGQPVIVFMIPATSLATIKW